MTITGPGLDPARVAEMRAIHSQAWQAPTQDQQDRADDAKDAEPSKTARELDTEQRLQVHTTALYELVACLNLVREALSPDGRASLFGAGGPIDQIQSVQTRILVRSVRQTLKGAGL